MLYNRCYGCTLNLPNENLELQATFSQPAPHHSQQQQYQQTQPVSKNAAILSLYNAKPSAPSPSTQATATSFNPFGQPPQVSNFQAQATFQSYPQNPPVNGAFGGLPPLPNIKSMPAPLSASQGVSHPVGMGFRTQPQLVQNVSFISP